MKKRHAVFWRILRPLAIVFLKVRFGYKFKVAKNLPPQYLVLSNHLTDYDPIFVGASFPRQMYYVASEHIARAKVAYAFLKTFLAPIMRYKGAPATVAIMEAMRMMKKGANVCIFAEGVRSWDGRSCPIAPSTAKLAKTMGCGLVTYKLTGGYFTSPMWGGASVRRGKISGEVVNVYTKEQLAEMTKEEVYEAVVRDLQEDAYERQLANPTPYKGKNPAKGLERLMFICPSCGKQDVFFSENDRVSCKSCGLTYTYDEYGMFHGGNHKQVRDFYDWQLQQLREDVANRKVYTAVSGSLKTVKNHVETPICSGEIAMGAETFSCGDFSVDMKEITDLAMHGQKAIVFSVNKDYYELIPAEGSNGLKFFLYYEEWKNNIKK